MITMVGRALLGLRHLASPQIGLLELRCALFVGANVLHPDVVSATLFEQLQHSCLVIPLVELSRE